MKKTLLIASLLAVALAACGKKEEAPAPAAAPAAEAPAAAAPAAAPAAAAPAAPAAPALNGFVVKSPMVGTFYRTPAPGSPDERRQCALPYRGSGSGRWTAHR